MKRAEEAFDELRRECMKEDYDADKIVELLRDIRRNNLRSAGRPWYEGNGRAFRDAKILPEVRLLAEAYLELFPMDAAVISTMVEIEDEEHLQDFLVKHTTCADFSERILLFQRYLRRGEAEKFEPERRYQLCQAVISLLYPRNLLKMNSDAEEKQAADLFREKVLSLIRSDAEDDRPDMWIEARLELGFASAIRAVHAGDEEDALMKLASVVKLLEDTMGITDEVLLPTSCRFLDGMVWRAKEDWMNGSHDPDGSQERIIYLFTEMHRFCGCFCIFPNKCLHTLQSHDFDHLRDRPEFHELCKRVEALVITRSKP